MEPVLLDKKRIVLAGFSYYGDPIASSAAWTEENEIGRLWGRFMKYCGARVADLPSSAVPGVGYEMHLWNDETLDTGHYEVFVGMELSDPVDAPIDLCVKIIPAASYAVFTVAGEVMLTELDVEIERALAAIGKNRSATYILNYYDQRYMGLERIDESEIDIYVPVQ